MPRLHLNPQLTVAYPRQGGGYTWTYASLLGVMLDLAQERFGPRDTGYTILGIEFTNGGRPRVWYPGNGRNLIVQLTSRCLHEPKRACYQLAHEAVHLIAPSGAGGTMTVLEEGAASWFAAYFMRERVGAPGWGSTMANYDHAEKLIQRLFDLDPNAIKKLRSDEPRISCISRDLLLRHYPELGETADHLAAPFEHGG